MRVLNQDSLTTTNPAPLMQTGNGFNGEEQSLSSIWRTIYKRKIIILCTTLAIFCAVAVHTMRIKPVYESVVRLQIDPSQSSNLGLDDIVGSKLGSEDPDSHLQTEVRLIQSDAVAMRVIDAMGLAKRPEFAGKSATGMKVTNPLEMSAPDRQRLVGALQGSLKVRIVPNTQLVEVRFRSTDPKLATDVANSVAEQYMQRNFQTHYQGAVQVSTWLAKEMGELQANAMQAQQKLAEFQKQNNILGADENENVVTDRLRLLNQQVTEAEADRIVKEARHRLAETGDPELFSSSSTLQTLRAQEADLKAQIDQLNSKYGSGYPKLRELQVQLTKLDAAIAHEINNVGKRLNNEYLAASKTESLLRGQFNQQKDEAYKLNEHAVQYSVLKHEVDTSRELYDTLQVKLKVAGVTAGLNSNYITVVDPAVLPVTPVEPRVQSNLVVGLFGGLITGLLLGFMVESFDDTISNSADLELYTALPVLCSVPNVASGEAEKGSRIPIVLTSPRSQAAEAFRGLRTSLLLSSADLQAKVIAVVSSVPSEGKTTMAANLGVSFAQRGESVLLIDADLRRPAMHTQFGLHPSRYGISTILTQGMSDSAILTPLEAFPNLKLIPAGPHPPNPAELLSSKRMVDALEAFSKEYDRIIIDTPPVLSVADPLVLSNLADATVLVVRSGVARKKAVLRVRDLLQRANSNLVGIVFNCVNLQMENYYYTSGSYYGRAMRSYYQGQEGEAD